MLMESVVVTSQWMAWGEFVVRAAASSEIMPLVGLTPTRPKGCRSPVIVDVGA